MKILEQLDSEHCQKTLKIEIPWSEVNSKSDEVYKEFIENANVPGFRRGKVPKYIVKMRYGNELNEESIQKTLEDAFKQACEELNLKPVTVPQFENIQKEKSEEPIVFNAKFEFLTQPASVDYQSIAATPFTEYISEKEIVEVLNQIREENAQFSSIDNRPVAKEDYVTISSQATIEGDPFPEATHQEIIIQVGSNRYLPGLEDALIGMKTGEEKTFTLTIPSDHTVEKYRGKTAEFRVTVKQIREKILPEIDDELAKDLGDFETLDALKEKIRKDLEKNLEGRKKLQIRETIRKELLARNPFEVPPTLIQNRFQFINANMDTELRRRGGSLKALSEQNPEVLKENEKLAEEDVRLSIILKKIAEVESIPLSDEEYRSHITKVAGRHRADPAWFFKKIETDKLEPHFREEALEEKVMDLLLAKVEQESNPLPE